MIKQLKCNLLVDCDQLLLAGQAGQQLAATAGISPSNTAKSSHRAQQGPECSTFNAGHTTAQVAAKQKPQLQLTAAQSVLSTPAKDERQTPAGVSSVDQVLADTSLHAEQGSTFAELSDESDVEVLIPQPACQKKFSMVGV